MKVYITKYALTQGIYEIEANPVSGGMVFQVGAEYPTYYRHNEWHQDQRSAAKRAEGMRVKKIASLQKQIRKLQALNFDVVGVES